MRRLLLVIVLLVLPAALTACRQACCAWENTKECVSSRFQNPCCPDECGVTWTEPVYDPVCASGSACGGP